MNWTQNGSRQTWPTDSTLSLQRDKRNSLIARRRKCFSEVSLLAESSLNRSFRDIQFFSIFLLPLGGEQHRQLNSTKKRSNRTFSPAENTLGSKAWKRWKQSNQSEQSKVTNSGGQLCCISKIVLKDKAMALASFQRFVSIIETLHRKETRKWSHREFEKLYCQISYILALTCSYQTSTNRQRFIDCPDTLQATYISNPPSNDWTTR